MREIEFLTRSMDPQQREQLRRCAEAQSERMRAFVRKLRGLHPREAVRLRLLAERLRAAWCCSFDAPAARAALLEYFRSIAGQPGSADDQRFHDLVDEFIDISKMCAPIGQPYDRIRQLSAVLFPELRSFETDLRDIAEAV